MLDIDECQNGPVCQQNAACLNMPGSYRCECKPGYRFTSTGQCLGKAGYQLKEVKGVNSTQIIQHITGVMHGCHCSLNRQGFRQFSGDYTELAETWSRIREKIRGDSQKTAVFHEDEADFSWSSCGLMLSCLLNLLYQTQSYETL